MPPPILVSFKINRMAKKESEAPVKFTAFGGLVILNTIQALSEDIVIGLARLLLYDDCFHITSWP